jgi:HEAT repeat protein
MTEPATRDVDGWAARLRDEDPVARCHAAKALGKLGAAAAGAVPELTDGLGDPDPMVRSMCAAALGKVGEAARPAVARLVETLRDPVVPVRFWAADALGRIGDLEPDARAALERTAADDDPLAKPARSAARKALARLGRDADRSP